MTTAGEVVELARGDRPLPTELHLPPAQPPWPLVVFAHGWMGHPDRFTPLFGRWTAAVVADVTAAFLDATLNGSAPRPLVDPALGRLEAEGVW